jgi:hypothetical protein
MLLRELWANPSAWEEVTFTDKQTAPISYTTATSYV